MLKVNVFCEGSDQERMLVKTSESADDTQVPSRCIKGASRLWNQCARRGRFADNHRDRVARIRCDLYFNKRRLLHSPDYSRPAPPCSPERRSRASIRIHSQRRHLMQDERRGSKQIQPRREILPRVSTFQKWLHQFAWCILEEAGRNGGEFHK